MRTSADIIVDWEAVRSDLRVAAWAVNAIDRI